MLQQTIKEFQSLNIDKEYADAVTKAVRQLTMEGWPPECSIRLGDKDGNEKIMRVEPGAPEDAATPYPVCGTSFEVIITAFAVYAATPWKETVSNEKIGGVLSILIADALTTPTIRLLDVAGCG